MAIALFHSRIASHAVGLALIQNAYLFVDFFFVISGFVISSAYLRRLERPADLAFFMIRRLGRLYPLHLFMLSLFVAIELLRLVGSTGGDPPFQGGTAPWTILDNLLLVQSIGTETVPSWNFPSWSISVEFYVTLLFGLMVIWGRPFFALLAWSAMVGSELSVVLWSQTGQDTTLSFGFFRGIVGFLAGVMVFQLHNRWRITVGGWNHALEIGTVIVALGFVSLAGRTDLSFAAPVIFAGVVWVFAREEGCLSDLLSRPFCRILGEWSYGIYMVHVFVAVTFVLRPIAWFERKSGLSLIGASPTDKMEQVVMLGSPWQADLLTLLYLVLVIAAAALVYRFIEQPCRTSINKLSQMS